MKRKHYRRVAVKEAKESSGKKPYQRIPNRVKEIRESLLMSKAELARKAGLSALTIDRVESGYNCRMDTKRKIILALGLRLSDKDKVFGDATGEEDDRDS
ncbi:MAG: helix-turn-helix domain-containing protein [Deltaproteobacteria bacterium]|nr:MAG: helix-turn-helix domain-containing protein [Deltaproteobacteria bacterium]